MSSPDLKPEIFDLAGRILAQLNSAQAPVTAWDIKMRLKVSHTRLYLALGALLERGEIKLRPQDLTFLVETARAPVEELRQA